jgi:hypothetical protein
MQLHETDVHLAEDRAERGDEHFLSSRQARPVAAAGEHFIVRPDVLPSGEGNAQSRRRRRRTRTGAFWIGILIGLAIVALVVGMT